MLFLESVEVSTEVGELFWTLSWSVVLISPSKSDLISDTSSETVVEEISCVRLF